MNSANVLLVCIAIFSIGSIQSSAIPLNCTVTSHQEIYVEVQTNGTVTCEISRRASKIIIEVVQCINNLTDCILDPGILIEKHDAHRTSTVTILSIRNHSEDLLVSCFDPYIKAPSTHLALPHDCLLLNHTYSDGVTETTNVEGQSNNYKAGILIGSVTGVVILAVICVVLWLNRRYIPLFEEARTLRKKQAKHEQIQLKGRGTSDPSEESKRLLPTSNPVQNNTNTLHEVNTNENKANDCHAQPSTGRLATTETTSEKGASANGTTESERLLQTSNPGQDNSNTLQDVKTSANEGNEARRLRIEQANNEQIPLEGRSTSDPSEESKRPLQTSNPGQDNANTLHEVNTNENEANESSCLLPTSNPGQDNVSTLNEMKSSANKGNERDAQETSKPEKVDNANGTTDCDAQPSMVKLTNTETTPENGASANGTTGVKDGVIILHATDDEKLARTIKEKIKQELGSDDKQLVDVSADVGIGEGQLSYLDNVLITYRWILFLETPRSQKDSKHLFKGEAVKVDNLYEQKEDDRPRFIQMLSNIKQRELKRLWLKTLIALDDSEHGIKNFVSKVIRGGR